ncbi:glycyl-radical enzyme activating protein [Ruminococcaceae bacterium OttesenSCG-928-A11]|nr:glycyl-radical enzyme activating protein [Ruminococcaceae bacterium OttesenSCG-928-A11]
MDEQKGFITDIQRFSLHDGPGIRTTVFMGGCNLRCAWCHNPETNCRQRQWQYMARRCIGCGACVQACPHRALALTAAGVVRSAALCRLCGCCAAACGTEAVQLVGRHVGREELLALLLRDRPYYAGQGGVTFSGGEPLLQAPFVAGMLARLRAEGVHTAVDTAGLVPWQAFERVLPNTSLFLFDIKMVDPALHRRYTGQDNALIQSNLRGLSRAGAKLWVRVPLMRGVNDGAGHAAALAGLLGGLAGVEQVDLLPYHDYGCQKAEGLDFQVGTFDPPDEAALEAFRRVLEAGGLAVHLHG